MPWYAYPLAMLLGYLIGSIPIGYLIGRTKGVNVLEHGSGRTGGTNVFRALGIRYGVLTGLGDLLKGALAVWLARAIFGHEAAAALAGAFAVFGHNWSVFLAFRGGAGGSTAAGALLTLNPVVGFILLPIFIAILLVVRYASVATFSVAVGATVLLTLFYFLDPAKTPLWHIVFGVAVLIMIGYSLRPNFVRLWHGNERRIQFNRS
ncbi:MAG: glycerol-3-phosphate 1-O-acyltransferase PlsY [Chloroflexi bacterium]|nr:glycerol-3-phosphate 1-O-acyltransferase PlsY [Chloroflexota bacterium]